MARAARPDPTAMILMRALALAALVAWVATGYPTAVLAPVCLALAAMMAPGYVGSGTRGAPATPAEARSAHRARLDAQAWRVATSLATTSTALPVGVGAGLLAATAPVTSVPGYPQLDRLAPLLNAVGVSMTLAYVSWLASARASVDEPRPRVGVSELWRGRPWSLVAAGAGAVAGGLAGWVALGGAGAAGGALAGAGLALSALGASAVAAPWREREQRRAWWAPRWAVLPKMDPAPTLVSTSQVGAYRVDTFEAPPGRGAAEMVSLASKVAVAVGAGTTCRVVEATGVDASGSEVAGTVHPTRFQVVTCPAGTVTDPLDPATDETEAELYLRCLVADWVDRWGNVTMPVAGTTVLTAPGAQRVWQVDLIRPNDYLDVTGVLAQAGPVVLDASTAYVGVLEGAAWAEEGTGELVADAAMRSTWEGAFRAVLRGSATMPQAQPKFAHDMVLEGVTVHYLPLGVPQGLDVTADLLPLGSRLRTTVPSAPFMALLGVPPTGRGADPGGRNDKFFSVVYTERPVPSSPAGVRPGAPTPAAHFDRRDVATLVVGGMVDAAWRAVYGDKVVPQVMGATCLTSSGPSIWQVRARLYGGMTEADLRGRAARLASALNVPWLRARVSGSDVELYVGASPSTAAVAPAWRSRVAELDFEQAFTDAKVVAASGAVPTLVEATTLPGNEAVAVSTFALPPGLARADVDDRLDRVAAVLGAGFIQVRPDADPSRVTILTSPTNPVPARVDYPFKAADAAIASGSFPWGVGVEGSLVGWAWKDTPHVLAAGWTGAGKSVAIRNAVYAALAGGWEAIVIDPSKGGVDFACFSPWLCGLIGRVDQAEAALKSVYAEVGSRKALAAAHGVGGIKDLPEDLRPPRWLVVIDEFTSLLLPEKVTKVATDDPEVLAEYEARVASNAARASIASLVGRIGREARSAGVHLLLGTQRLSSKTLEAVPGGDLKDNLGRLALGQMTWGQRASALRSPEAAPRLTTTPVGRGIWEPMTGFGVEQQTAYAEPEAYEQALRERGLATRDDLGLSAWLPQEREATFTETIELAELDLSGIEL